MLASQRVSAGKYYVNSERNIAREVTETSDRTIKFITYHLDTGRSSGVPSECMIRHFTHWADHEATRTEIARLLRQKTQAL